jgi:hypothetical protein
MPSTNRKPAQDTSVKKVFGFVVPSNADAELLKQTIVSVLSMVLLGMVFVVFVYPKYQELQKTAVKVNTMKKQLDGLNNSLFSLDKFTSEISEDQLALLAPILYLEVTCLRSRVLSLV